MTQDKDGVLSSEELEQDRSESRQTTLTPADAEGHTLPASEADIASDEDEEEGRDRGAPIAHPNPILPPD